MMDGDKMLVLYLFDGDPMILVCIFRFQGRQGDAAAADDRSTAAMNHIAANGADIEFAPKHIAGDVLVGDVLTVHQLNNRDTQGLSQRLQQGNIRQTFGSFPFGDGLAADTKSVCQFGLGQFPAFPKLFDGCTCHIGIHHYHSLLEIAYHETPNKTTYAA